MTQVSEHFSAGPPDNMACQDDCGFGATPEDYAAGFLDFLEIIRVIFARPIHPESGARCVTHNRAVGGVNLSAHTRATAADLKTLNGFDRHGLVVAYVLALAVCRGLLKLETAIAIAAAIAADRRGGLGIAKNFVHVDSDIHLPRPSAWGYPPNTHNR